ncbi:MAG: ComF family protein [Alphaproteobacteria bacterium]|nr:ComF family protein [Alphaproteobacteria bacterium]
MLQSISELGRLVVDAVFPPQCPSCEAIVREHAQLCADCWSRLRFIGEPMCACCGIPLEFEGGEGTLCLRCLAAPPAFARARAVLLYDAFSRGLVLKFKNGDRLDPARAFSRWMARAGGALLREADMVAPVPLHWSRLVARRYNQSAVLARHVAAQAGRPCVPDLLQRMRRTPSQGTLGRKERAGNVRGAFAVSQRYAGQIAGRAVVLVDDVLTTGATADNCAKVLLRAGAVRVDVLTLARVALPDQATI